MKPTAEMIEVCAPLITHESCGCMGSGHDTAEPVLAAAMPLIVEAVAERIAERLWDESQIPLREQAKMHPTTAWYSHLGARALGLQRAVDIARAYGKEQSDD